MRNTQIHPLDLPCIFTASISIEIFVHKCSYLQLYSVFPVSFNLEYFYNKTYINFLTFLSY